MGKQHISAKMEFVQHMRNEGAVRIKFNDGETRVYHDVPDNTVARMMASEIIDQFFEDHIANSFSSTIE